MDKVAVKINPASLEVVVTLSEQQRKVGHQLKLLFGSYSDDFTQIGTELTLPWHDFIRVVVPFSSVLKKGSVNVEFDALSESLLREYVKANNGRKYNTPFIEFSIKELEQSLKEHGFHRDLKEKQKRDARYLLKLRHGANFSVPGAGKTTTILSVHTTLKAKEIVNKLLVVSPINAFISWEDEIKEIFGKDQFKILRLKKDHLTNYNRLAEEKADVFLVNYEKLRGDVSGLIPLFFNENVHLILDESHRIKGGFSTQSYPQLAKLSDLAKRKDIMSGTPMPQSYEDLIPQFGILWPGIKIIPDLSLEKNQEAIIQKVNVAISSLYVRTTKAELELDDPKITYSKVDLGPLQKELYRLIRSEMARITSDMDHDTRRYFRSLNRSAVRLLQASTNPMLLTAGDDYYEDDEPMPIPKDSEIWDVLEEFAKHEKPGKIEYLRDRVATILDEKKENKVVVWSFFVRNILLLKELLKEHSPAVIYGGVPSGDEKDITSREGQIRKFHDDPSCRIMIANPQACGEGISLHKVCHYAIYLDRNFNAAHYLQSVDRIHRLGLDKGVETQVEILIAEDTLDRRLVDRLNEKISNMGYILDDKYLRTIAYDPFDVVSVDPAGMDEQDAQLIRDHITSDRG